MDGGEHERLIMERISMLLLLLLLLLLLMVVVVLLLQLLQPPHQHPRDLARDSGLVTQRRPRQLPAPPRCMLL